MSSKIKLQNCWVASLLSVTCLAAPSADRRVAEAVKDKDAAAVRSLLKQQADVKATLGDGSTALAWAAHWNDLDTADLLIRAGANVNAANYYGDTPLWEACNNASAAMVEKLSKAGANPNATLPGTGETTLMRCARAGSADAVNSLIAHGADVNAKEKQKGQTALMWALEERHSEAARALMEHGADIHAKSKGGFTPLLFAARRGDVAAAQMMVEKGADVNEIAPGGQSALLLATDCGQEAFAIFLVERGANVNATDPNGLTALHYALRRGVSILRAAIHDPQFGQMDYVLRPDMRELVNALLDHGANPNARIKTDLSRLTDNSRLMLWLSGATPFLLASATGDVPVMKALLAKGADPKLATNDNTTALMVAAGVSRQEDRSKEEVKQDLEALNMLVELGLDVNAQSKEWGLTALHGAAFNGADEIVKFLVEKGARLDIMDKYGETPLSIAEGDPNGLRSDFGGVITPNHPSTAALIRQLGGNIIVQADATPVSTASK